MHRGVATRRGCRHRPTARPKLGCLPAPALLALLGAVMHYHWGSSQTIQAKGARLRPDRPSHGQHLRSDIAPLRGESKPLKAQATRQATVKK